MTTTLTHEELREVIRPRNFNPADVQVVGWLDTLPPRLDFNTISGLPTPIIDEAIAEFQAYRAGWVARNVQLFGREYPGSSCEHCGQRIRWAGIVRYLPTGQHFIVGETCAEERMSLDNRREHDLRLLRMSIQHRAEMLYRLQARARFHREYPAEAELLFRDVHSASDFLASLRGKLLKYGELTERQLAALTKQVNRERERAERDAARDAALADTPPLPEGRRTVKGVVISTKIVDGEYGTTYKMLVQEADGNRVWGTIPKAINDSETWQDMQTSGAVRVRFDAKVERSDRDEHFGFYSRPTKAEVTT